MNCLEEVSERACHGKGEHVRVLVLLGCGQMYITRFFGDGRVEG